MAEVAATSPLPPPNNATAAEEIRERADTVWTRGEPAQPWPREPRVELAGPRGRVAIVAGCRTPFVKAGEGLAELDAIDLASRAATEVLARVDADPASVDLCVFGVVAPPLNAPNLGREVVLRAGLPSCIPGNAVNQACASSAQALVDGARAILNGDAEVVLAGGAESLSNLPVLYSRNTAQRLMELSKVKGMSARLAVLRKLRFKDLTPATPTITESTTGQTAGEACEEMARQNDVCRRAQDEIALLSHRRAASAMADGRLAEQIIPVFPPSGPAVLERDSAVRPDTSATALAALEPVFDQRFGSLTAGNSSPLTDGAVALLLMSEAAAEAGGYEPLGYLRSYAFAAVDPARQLLQSAVYAVPRALDRAGLRLEDVDLVEMHEAYAAQVLSNLKALASSKFARHELGREQPVGVVSLDRFNVTGGSIAFGHPFGATGARLVLQLLSELRRRGDRPGLGTGLRTGLQTGLVSLSAAGGTGCALLFERE